MSRIFACQYPAGPSAGQRNRVEHLSLPHWKWRRIIHRPGAGGSVDAAIRETAAGERPFSRRRSDSNRCITLLQSVPLATWVRRQWNRKDSKDIGEKQWKSNHPLTPRDVGLPRAGFPRDECGPPVRNGVFCRGVLEFGIAATESRTPSPAD